MRTFGRLLLAVGFVGMLVLGGGTASASSASASSTSSESIHQDIDLDFDNVLLALALDRNADLDDIADIDRTFTRSSIFDSDIDLDRDDVLLALALDDHDARDLLLWDSLDRHRIGTFGHFGHLGGFGTFGLSTFPRLSTLDDDCDDLFFEVGDTRCRSAVSTHVTQRVDFDEDDVLSALALRNAGGFWLGGLGILSVADFDRTVSITEDFDRDVDFDDEDVLLALALD